MERPPKKNGEDKLEGFLRVRLPVTEKQKLIEDAKVSGFKNVSKYARNKLLSNSAYESSWFISRETLLVFLAHLGKVGSNINQIAKVVNRRELIGEPIGITSEHIKTSLIEVDKLVKQLLEIIKNECSRKTAR